MSVAIAMEPIMGRRRNNCRPDAGIFATTNFLLRLVLVIPVTTMVASVAQAAQWNVTPRVQVEETINSNVFLAPVGAEESDRISQINPGLLVEADGSRLRLRMDYALQNVYYSRNAEHNESWQQLDSRAGVELIRDALFLDASALYTQQVVSSEEGIPQDNASISDNRTNVATMTVRPRLQNRIAGVARADFSYGLTQTNYDLDTVPDLRETDVRGSMQSLNENNGFTWRIASSYRKLEPDNDLDSQLGRVGFELQLPVARRARFLLDGGREDNVYHTGLGAEVERGGYWYAGLAWQPGRRLSAQARIGERFFGRSSSFSLMHQGKRWQWNVRYQEELEGSVRKIFPDEPAASTALPLGEARPGSDIFLQKNFTVDGVREYGKVRMAISAYDRRREFRTTDENERVTGGSLNAMWRVAPKSRLGGTLTRQNEELRATTRRDELLIYQLEARRELWRGSELYITRRYYRRDSTDSLSEYRQIVLSAGLSATF